MGNYIELHKFSLFNRYYLVIDTDRETMASIVSAHNIRFRTVKAFLNRSTEKYMVRICKVRKSDCDRFESLMPQLHNTALLLGYKEYEDICDEVARLLAREERLHMDVS